jgi:hypothetical protein
MADKGQRYSVSEEVINDVLKYLSSKPYTEVSEIVAKVYADAKPESVGEGSPVPQEAPKVSSGSAKQSKGKGKVS